ncbi:MAG: hypothetical protein C5S52_07075 [ANME-2 cluster archaeon]|nr:hypothetical protein [ANME-2 cluster archaeon]
MGKGFWDLERSGNSKPADGVGLEFCHILSLKKYLPFLRREEPGDRVEQGGLTGPIRADKTNNFTGMNTHIHVIQGYKATKTF